MPRDKTLMTGAESGPLVGLTVIELSAFVAAPLAGGTLAALGASVTRIEQTGGGIDARRWPLAPDGRSLYREGLDRGKQMLPLDLRSEDGRATATARIADADALVTNLPATGWTAFDNLVKVNPRLVMVVITGTPGGGSAVDYTVNAGVGFPLVTGPPEVAVPVNHVLPAWDVAAALNATTALLAGLRRRDQTGRPVLVEVPLTDVALTTLARLGYLAEAAENPEPRPRTGNSIFGTYGASFATADGRYVMVCALTPRQWHSLIAATGLTADLDDPALELDEAERYRHRHKIDVAVGAWIAQRALAEVAEAFDSNGVLWSPYRTFKQLLAEDPRAADPPATAIRFVKH